MNKIHRTLGLMYGELAAEMAMIVNYQVFAQHGTSIELTDIGSGDSTTGEYKGVTKEFEYTYLFENEELKEIKLDAGDSSEHPIIITIKVTPHMRSLYKEIMQTTHLLSECMKKDKLTDEAAMHSENWSDALLNI